MSGDCRTVAELCASTGASPWRMEQWIREWLERGIVERVNGGYRATPEWREAIAGIRASNVPLEPDDDDGLGHCKPGPAKAAA